MLQQLLRAHSVFLLHHAATLDDLYSRLPRSSFCTLLDRFWARFIWNWDVLLYGNPAVDIYNGIKLAGGGELGIGVGEEEWGSGEREVLEDFVARTEGLIDLVVSRFGDAPDEPTGATAGQNSPGPSRQQQALWLAADLDPRPSDGVLFSGIGAISRRSLATVSQWMAEIYKYGEDAYGVGENPTVRPRRRKQRGSSRVTQLTKSSEGRNSVKRNITSSSRGRPPVPAQSMSRHEPSTNGIPPPLVKVVEQSLEHATAQASSKELKRSRSPTNEQQGSVHEKQDPPLFGTDTMMKYLNLGYGSSWTLNPKGFSKSEQKTVSGHVSLPDPREKPKVEGPDPTTSTNPDPPQLNVVEPYPEVSDNEDSSFVQRLEKPTGKFLIGLSGDLENQDFVDDDTDAGPRIVLRTLTVALSQPSSTSKCGGDATASATPELNPSPGSSEAPAKETSSCPTPKQVQVAIYVNQPFIFAFFFELHTLSLTYPSFYRSIHHQLGPLQKPLLRSTDPSNVAARIANAMGEGTTTTATSRGKATTTPPIHDLIYDPEKLTIHGSLPNIPPPRSLAAEGLATETVSGSWYTLGIPTSSSSPSTPGTRTRNTTTASTGPPKSWTRVEALNIHTQILNTYMATRRLHGELERTVKTGRGWWVLWMRVQGRVNADADDAENRGLPKEAVLVRRARDDGGAGPASNTERRHVSSGAGMGGWLVRESRRDASGSSGVGGTTMGVSSVAEGVGVEARRWIEGLLSLNR